MTRRLALFGEHTLPACPFRLPAGVRLGSARVSRLPVTRWAVLVATIGLAGACSWVVPVRRGKASDRFFSFHLELSETSAK
jgi:hypothetical protein